MSVVRNYVVHDDDSSTDLVVVAEFKDFIAIWHTDDPDTRVEVPKERMLDFLDAVRRAATHKPA